MHDPYPVTPDGRYFVVRTRLWRCSDPFLPTARRQELVGLLMAARRALRTATTDRPAVRARIDAAKQALGERGAPWWTDGEPDYNRRLVKNTPYAAWFDALAR